jgi:hypothetical protein
MDAEERRAYERQQEQAIQAATASEALDEMKMFSESAAEYASRRLDEGLRNAVEAMVDLCDHTDDDKLRFAAAKYILDRAFGSTSPTSGKYAERENDPLYDFVAKVVKQGES